jgi:isoleucyl-tRNA synthetase
MLGRTDQLAQACFSKETGVLGVGDQGWYPGFEFHRVFHALHDYAVVDLSAFYFDVLKDRLYTFATGNIRRRSAQTAVFKIARSLCFLIAPILPFTAEEVWKYLPHLPGDPESIHLCTFPRIGELVSGQIFLQLNTGWTDLVNLVRTPVLKKLEEARQSKLINGSLDAKVTLSAPAPAMFLEKYKEWLRELLIVSQVEVELLPRDPLALTTEQSEPSISEIRITRAEGAKCERCWNYSTHVGENADYPTVCERCVKALNEIEESGHAAERGAVSS